MSVSLPMSFTPQTYFCNAFRCPLNGEALSLGERLSGHIYRLWFSLVKSHIAEALYARTLNTFDGYVYEPDLADLESFSDEELIAAATGLAESRRDKPELWRTKGASVKNGYLGLEYHPLPSPTFGVWIDEIFECRVKWLREFKVKPRSVRPKHWPNTQSLDKQAFLKESLVRKCDGQPEGLLLPNIVPSDLLRTCCDGLAYLIERKFWELEDLATDSDSDCSAMYVLAWDSIMEKGGFRFCVWHEVPIGAYNGEFVDWMVFDFDPGGKQVHCYPAPKPLGGQSPEVSDDGIGELAVVGGMYQRGEERSFTP